MTQTTTATSTPHRSTRCPEDPTGFEAKCHAVTDAMKRIGTRLRIALAADSDAEPFLIHARYEIDSRMHVYRQAETETAITGALKLRPPGQPTGSSWTRRPKPGGVWRRPGRRSRSSGTSRPL